MTESRMRNILRGNNNHHNRDYQHYERKSRYDKKKINKYLKKKKKWQSVNYVSIMFV